ncbi:hypothetical protein BBP40_000288 [Aspergillus hancockii]|nr:hypothetical protein BBP40_000288 [Aspergillus hancockii]
MKLTNLAPWALLCYLPAAVHSLPSQGTQSKNDHRVAKILKRHDGLDHKSADSDHVYKTKFAGVTWSEENWLLKTTTLDQGHYQSRGSVANGYLGINVASVGPFFELDREVNGDVINGWPLFSRRQSFATIAGFFDSQPTTNGTNFPWLSQYGWDTAISGVPHWSGLILDLGDGVYLDSTVDNKTISDFQSSYDFKAGVLSWSYTWSPPNKGVFEITYRLFANKLNITQAVVDLEIIPSVDGEATVANVLDGSSAVRTDFVESDEEDGAIFSAVRPWGVSNVTAYIYANLTGSDNVDLSSRTIVAGQPYVGTNESSIAQTVNVKFSAKKPVRVTKFVGGASTDAFADPKQTAKEAVSAALAAGYAKSLKSHASEWAIIMHENSVDRFTDPATGKLPDDQHIIDSAVIAVTNIYYLLQNTVSKNAIAAVANAPVNETSFSVGGLTSDSYAGQVFWDADVWMQPGLVASHPEAAQGVTNYRVAKYQQAKDNIQTAFTSSKNQTRFDPSAAIYPWTSGRVGNCTATGACFDYQYHLNGDIGLSMIYQWVASGDTQYFQEKHFPIYDSVATMYSNIVERNGSSWTLTNMTDPDEYANHIDAGGFTMPLIAQTLDNANAFRKQFNLEPNETWSEIAENILMLRQNNVTLEYTSMNGTAVVKQADIVLVTYPLAYESDNYTDETSLHDLDYYANKQSADGPAMTWAIFSIVASDVSPSGCSAYTYHQYSYDPYSRAPFFQLSEQMLDNASLNGGTHPAYPFLTGHGGANQVVLFGYLGLRLLPDAAIHIAPDLPPQIPYVKYRTFYWRGWPIAAESNYTHTIIRRDTETSPLPTADERFRNATIHVYIGTGTDSGPKDLPPTGSPLTVPNRMIGTIPSIEGNQIQCQPITSPDAHKPGQFPISANDGATSTKWQPASSNRSSITVTLSDAQIAHAVTGFYFDWASSPPVKASVIFHEDVIEDPVAVFTSSSAQSEGQEKYRVVLPWTDIEPSRIFTAEEANKVWLPAGNTTTISLKEEVDASRYATLLISGNQAIGSDEEDTDMDDRNSANFTPSEDQIQAMPTLTPPGRENSAVEADADKELDKIQPPTEPYTIFSPRERSFITLLVGFATITSPFTATVYFPLLPVLKTQFNVSSQEINLTLTIYIIFQALSPAIFGPLSDSTGRRPAYLITLTIYTLANLGMSLNKHDYGLLLLFRALQSLGASAAFAISYGIVADVCVPSERGKMMGGVSMALNLGTCIGPILGGLVTHLSGESAWIFWVLFIVGIVLFFVVGLFLPETARSLVGNGSDHSKTSALQENGSWNTFDSFYRKRNREDEQRGPKPVIWTQLHARMFVAPFQIIFLPDAFLCLWMHGSFYAVDYILAATVSGIYKDTYGFNTLFTGLCYLPRGVGIVLGGYCNGRMMDHNYKVIARKHNRPIDRVLGDDMHDFPIELVRSRGSYYLLAVSTATLLAYGWTVDYRGHFSYPLILQFIQGFGGTCFYTVYNTLLVDSFPLNPSTAAATASIARVVFYCAWDLEWALWDRGCVVLEEEWYEMETATEIEFVTYV